MSLVNIIRAWKDEAYRASLSDAERAALPANPAGAIELTEAELDNVAGGQAWSWNCSWGCPTNRFVCTSVNCRTKAGRPI
jgi:mersacidin/lichenicidin family type 2 lantibiotic